MLSNTLLDSTNNNVNITHYEDAWHENSQVKGVQCLMKDSFVVCACIA